MAPISLYLSLYLCDDPPFRLCCITVYIFSVRYSLPLPFLVFSRCVTLTTQQILQENPNMTL